MTCAERVRPGQPDPRYQRARSVRRGSTGALRGPGQRVCRMEARRHGQRPAVRDNGRARCRGLRPPRRWPVRVAAPPKLLLVDQGHAVAGPGFHTSGWPDSGRCGGGTLRAGRFARCSRGPRRPAPGCRDGLAVSEELGGVEEISAVAIGITYAAWASCQRGAALLVLRKSALISSAMRSPGGRRTPVSHARC